MVRMQSSPTKMAPRKPLIPVLPLIAASILCLILPAPAQSQGTARDAMSIFPADTQQMVFLNMAQLRGMAEWPQIRTRVLTRQLRDFQDFMRSVGIDPEKDVDEVVLGWRGENNTGMVGRAEGRFDPDHVRALFKRQSLPVREYMGHELYAFGSGEDSTDVLFAFLSSSSAAFGLSHDLKDLIEVSEGSKPALETNATFVGWEAELEGTAPQWGISTGKAAASAAGPWLAAGGKLTSDPSALFGNVRAYLYRIDWSGGVNTRVSIVCGNDESATALSQLLSILRDARTTSGSSPMPAGFATILQGLDVHSNGSRVELSTSAPLDVIDKVLRGATGEISQ